MAAASSRFFSSRSGRLAEGRQIEAALIGAVGEIGLGRTARRRGGRQKHAADEPRTTASARQPPGAARISAASRHGAAGRPVRMGPDRIAQRDELGPRRGERPRRPPGSAHRRRRASRRSRPTRPPAPPRSPGRAGSRPGGARRRAGNRPRPRRALMASSLVRIAADADGALALQPLAQLAHAGRVARDVDAVGAAPGRDGGEVRLALGGDDQRPRHAPARRAPAPSPG